MWSQRINILTFLMHSVAGYMYVSATQRAQHMSPTSNSVHSRCESNTVHRQERQTFLLG